MVGDDGDEGAIEAAGPLQRRDQAADAGVDVGDLAVVGRRLEAGGERRRRIVRRVRVVQVHPAEERLRAAAASSHFTAASTTASPRRCTCSLSPSLKPGKSASKVSNPCAKPYGAVRMKAPTNPPVR